ncbi:MAG: radical SAM family heme chaperone HemW [Chlamydiales bacterium]
MRSPISATEIVGVEVASSTLTQMNGDLALYIHVPFCKKKCGYCHFYVVRDRIEHQKIYVQALVKEIESWCDVLRNAHITSIYFGGGTPFLLEVDDFATILNTIKNLTFFSSEIEITVEANPETIELSKCQRLRELDVNRLSIGIQSLDDNLLALLTREHDAAKAIDSVWTAYDAGFRNLSIDLMYDIPDQTYSQWENTLDKVGGLPISHLSLYNLTIEPHTSFYKQRENLVKRTPEPIMSTEMYRAAQSRLREADFQQYEISAFAKRGFQAKHNSTYWTGQPFLGFGPSSFSYFRGERFRNIPHLLKYKEKIEQGDSVVDFREELSPEARIRELLIIRLRLLEGVDLNLFQLEYGQLNHKILEDIHHLIEKGLLTNTSGILKLTDRGVLFYDTVAETLV